MAKPFFTSEPFKSPVLAVWQQTERDRQELEAGRWKASRAESDVGFHEPIIAIGLGLVGRAYAIIPKIAGVRFGTATEMSEG